MTSMRTLLLMLSQPRRIDPGRKHLTREQEDSSRKGGEIQHLFSLRAHLSRSTLHASTSSLRRGLAGDQHRARCRADHLFRHTTQEDMGQTSTPVGPHDNKIHLSRLGSIENLLKGDAMHHGTLRLKPSGCEACEVACQIFHDGFFQIFDKSRGRPCTHVSTRDEWRLDHMQEDHACLEFLRESNGIVQGQLSIRAKVDWNENMSDSHDDALSSCRAMECRSSPGYDPGRKALMRPSLHKIC